MRIGIDVDDVLADFVSAFAKIAHEMFGTDPNLKPVDWGWSNFGLSAEQISAVWQHVRQTPNFWYTLAAVPTATVHGFVTLFKAGAKFFFITKRFDTKGAIAEDQTAAWIEENFNLPYPVVLANTPKGLTAKALELTHFIDDRPENCLDVLEHVPTCQVYIKDTTHNRHFGDSRIPRVASFNEFAETIGGQ